MARAEWCPRDRPRPALASAAMNRARIAAPCGTSSRPGFPLPVEYQPLAGNGSSTSRHPLSERRRSTRRSTTRPGRSAPAPRRHHLLLPRTASRPRRGHTRRGPRRQRLLGPPPTQRDRRLAMRQGLGAKVRRAPPPPRRAPPSLRLGPALGPVRASEHRAEFGGTARKPRNSQGQQQPESCQQDPHETSQN